MQFLSAQPLIEKYRNGTFDESQVGPYFMAYMILTSALWTFAYGEPDPWSIASGAASVVITVFGILHLKKQNGESFGNHFLSKYFSLGWVTSIRMVLLAIPAAVVFFALSHIVGGPEAISPAGALFGIAFEVAFYWWLGLLFAQSNGAKLAQDSETVT